jgi:hypothetical protein
MNKNTSFTFENGNEAGKNTKSTENKITWASLQQFWNKLQPGQGEVIVKDLEFPEGLEFLSEVNPAQFANYLNTQFPANDPREANKKDIIQLIRSIILRETSNEEITSNISKVKNPLNVEDCASVKKLLIASGLFTKEAVINPKENYTTQSAKVKLKDATSVQNGRYIGNGVTQSEFDGWTKETQQAYLDKNK